MVIVPPEQNPSSAVAITRKSDASLQVQLVEVEPSQAYIENVNIESSCVGRCACAPCEYTRKRGERNEVDELKFGCDNRVTDDISSHESVPGLFSLEAKKR